MAEQYPIILSFQPKSIQCKGCGLSPDVSIIIVNWNTKDLLRDCLASVYATHGSVAIETIVVDNASSDQSSGMLLRGFPQVQLIVNRTNQGFAHANNQALRVAHGRYVMLLNSDTIVLPGALRQMVRFMDAHPGVGVLGPRLLNRDHSLQSSMRDFPRLRDDVSGILEVRKWPYIGGLTTQRHAHADISWSAHASTREVDWVTGACQLLRRETIEVANGLDEGYFFFFEDMDLCFRLRWLGWRTAFIAEAEIIHLGGQSSKQVPLARVVWHFKGMLRFYRLHYSRRQTLVLRVAIVVASSVRLVWLMIRSGYSRNARLALSVYARVVVIAVRRH